MHTPYQNTMPPSLPAETELADLPPIVRVILTTDGTVSSLLKHWFQEPVVVTEVDEKEIAMADPTAANQQPQRVIERHIQLTGQTTGHHFLRAHSLLYPENIPHTLLAQIQQHPQGIGGALNETRSEHLRQLCGWGKLPESDAVWREYRVIMSGRLLMQIREVFPLALFR